MRSVARSAVERVLPERLGRPFRWLVTSSWISNIGDGVALAAGPLLVASETRSPLLVALAAVMQFLPRLLFGLVAGVVADRVDRRHLIAVANACRVVVLAALVTTLVTGQVSIAVVLGAVFLLGVGETFADTTTATLLPMLVAKADLGVANARLLAGIITLDQLVGPPLGALLFGLGRQWPFVTQAVCVALSLLLVLHLQLPAHGRRAAGATDATGGRGSTLVAEIREGLGWVRRHAAVRTLVLTILIFNVTFGASWSVLVLYAQERLGLGNLGFGLLTSALACGGILGTVSYGWLERHVSLAWIMRGGLVVETLTHLVLALTTVPAVALATMFVFGAHAFIWGTTSTAVRQRAVPMPMQGRVQSVYMLGVTGGFVLGSLLGGVVAHAYGVTAPFWVGFVGSAAFLALLWHQLLHVAHADEEALARAGTDEPAS
ncbi:Predicted arabinose efflux permease, MFS family [Nocardioides scoriae]|uniref:Predicted arabinose efflux permease, MFS family n=1 Tax=Nocardioides scoriae TaxID=642780 RepID=A0A1H1YFE7_9ACTN|nr:MFS transporter [Nocardioides scoriae]SDT19756.1 Predicted arabinose efflux permease, MFS family [Nocardioides scoriae]